MCSNNLKLPIRAAPYRHQREAAAFAREVGAPWTPMHHDLYDVNRCAPGEPERESALAGSVTYPLAPMQSLTLQNGAVNAAE